MGEAARKVITAKERSGTDCKNRRLFQLTLFWRGIGCGNEKRPILFDRLNFSLHLLSFPTAEVSGVSSMARVEPEGHPYG